MSTYLPTLKQLQYLVALHEHGHFGRAADACFVSQSTLSAGLRDLEVAGVQFDADETTIRLRARDSDRSASHERVQYRTPFRHRHELVGPLNRLRARMIDRKFLMVDWQGRLLSRANNIAHVSDAFAEARATLRIAFSAEAALLTGCLNYHHHVFARYEAISTR